MNEKENITDSLPQAMQVVRKTYDRTPNYHQSFLSHPVYLRAQELFDRQINDYELASGENFVQIVGDAELEIGNVAFLDWAHRGEHGAARVIKPSAYMFDSRRNAVRLLDRQGRVHQVNVEQFGLAEPSAVQSEESIRVRIPSNHTPEDISIDFTLTAKEIAERDEIIDESAHRTTDRLVIEQATPQLNESKVGGAYQRHADYFVNMLLLLDPDEDRERLYLEMGQINAAVSRLENEEVGSNFHLGIVQVKLRSAAGGFVEKYLGKLVEADIQSPDDIKGATTALKLVEEREFEYPVNVEFLKKQLELAKEKYSK